jgi:hypothetical protein
VAVMPVLLGAGIPLLPPGASTQLVLADKKILPKSGIVMLAYSIPGGVPAPRIRYIKTKSIPAKKKAAARKRARTTRR